MWRFLFSPRGRLSRSDLWVKYMLPLAGAAVLARLLDHITFGHDVIVYRTVREQEIGIGVFILALGLFYVWPSVALLIKRVHDLNASGWWIAGLYGPLAAPCVVGAWIRLVSRPGGFAGFTLSESDSVVEFVALGTLLVTVYVALFALLIYLVILFVLRGGEGNNRFGDDPLAARQ